MSVTKLLNEDSPFKRWLHTNLPLGSFCKLLEDHNRTMKRQRLIVRPVGQIDFARSGMAFTYGLRWWIKETLSDWLPGTVAWGGLKTWNLNDPFLAHFQTFSPLGAVLLAEFDKIGRGYGRGEPILDEQMNYLPHDPTFENTIEDVGALCRTLSEVFNRDQFSTPIHSNPTFAGSEMVKGADAQLITGRTLFDVRTTLRKEPANLRNMYQQISYLLLDFDDRYGIEQLAWYYSRQRAYFIYPVETLVPDVVAMRQKLYTFLSDQKSRPGRERPTTDVSFGIQPI